MSPRRMVPVWIVGWLLVFAGQAPETPILCVEARGDAPVDAKELIAAIRARIARNDVAVERCGARPSSTWRVVAAFKKKDEVDLTLEGRDIDAHRSLYIGGLGRQEISQTIALTAVEMFGVPDRPDCTIEGEGRVLRRDFRGAKELGAVLAAADEVKACATKQLFRFAVGRVEEPGDQPTLAAMRDQLELTPGLEAMILALVESPAITHRPR